MRAWLLFGLVLGCTDGAQAPSDDQGDLPDAPRIFADIARIRQLPKHEQPIVRFARHREYLAAGAASAGHEKNALDDQGVQRGLGLLDEGHVSRATSDARLLASDGFYENRSHTVYVLDDPSRRFPVIEELVLAHEFVHALQDQNGLLPAPEARFGTDEELARRALIEGDATLGMLLYEERNWHTPLARLAARVERGFARDPISRYLGATKPELANAPRFQQEMVLFPYDAGAAFVAALLATGGQELLAKAFASPPGSTAQVLHPERYARGERPVPIPPPRAPAGYDIPHVSVLGELLTRSQLLRCNSDAQAIRAAEGWRGDLFVTMRHDAGTLTAQQWLMDSAADAHDLAEALYRQCASSDAASGEQRFVSQRGARVVALRGAPADVQSTLANQWLSVEIPVAAMGVPLGAQLSPHVASEPEVAPTLSGGVLHFPAAGVDLQAPEGYDPDFQIGADLIRKPHSSGMRLRLALGEYFPGAAEQILLTVSRGMSQAIAYSNVVPSGKPYPLQLPTGEATALDFTHDGTVYDGRVVAVSLCGGRGLLLVVQDWNDSSGERTLKHALETLRPMAGATYCERLPK
jgi:hypothetical protein